MRRGTTLAPESIASRVEAAARTTSQPMRPGWDSELTELDLRLDLSQLGLMPRPSVITIENRIPADDDLPMLDDSEFVAALGLEDLDRSRRRIARSPKSTRQPSVDRTAWAAFAFCAAFIFLAWMVRLAS